MFHSMQISEKEKMKKFHSLVYKSKQDPRNQLSNLLLSQMERDAERLNSKM